MTPEERKQAIDELKQICREIGCSGLSPDMCQNKPHYCDIIRKLILPPNNNFIADRTANAVNPSSQGGG